MGHSQTTGFKNFWQYRRFWFIALVAILLAHFFLPSIPLLRGWEKKLTSELVKLDKSDVPPGSFRVNSIHELAQIPDIAGYDYNVIDLKGPLLVALWKCKFSGTDNICLRHIWKGINITTVIKPRPKKAKESHGPFILSGKNGYMIVQGNWVTAMATDLSLGDILEAWPTAQHLELSAPTTSNL